MQKIKFKTEYKPLADEVINKHKNFDVLLAAYAATPQLTFLQQLLKNKWTMFSGGIIIGTVATLLITVNQQDKNNISEAQNFNQTEINNSNSISLSESNNTIAVNQEENNNKISLGDAQAQNSNVASFLNNDVNQTQNNTSLNANPKNVNNTRKKSFTYNKNEIVKNNKVDAISQKEKSSNISEELLANVVDDTENNAGDVKPKDGPQLNSLKETDENKDKNFNINPALIKSQNVEDTAILNTEAELAEYFDKIINEVAVNFNNENNTAEIDDNIKTKKQDSTNDLPKNSENNTTSNSEISHIETKNDSSQTTLDGITFLDKFFDKRIAKKDTLIKNTDDEKRTLANRINDTTYIDRYAQLSFFSPLGTNGLDSYKYKHHFSINIIQGLNGAVEGAEFGGVANLDKGYVHGGQFAGVTNLVAGEITGVQAAGVLNVGRALFGGQFAGVANVSIFGVTGMQGAGVANYSGKSVNGMQAAGVLNVSSSFHDSTHVFQAAGVANVVLSDKAKGIQASGVLNVANTIDGGQIGLVNVAKNITGFQIGLVNIADTIDGVAIGLLSFSRNGIFDVDVFTSDIFNANIGIRIGSQYIYNIFAFGISPFSDTLQFGYGLGIGGHLPIKNNFAIDIDAMTWSTFEEKFDYSNTQFRLLNQLRVLPEYTFGNSKISVYGGPVLNVEVYEDGVTPLKQNTIVQYGGSGFTTALSLGYVLGIRFF